MLIFQFWAEYSSHFRALTGAAAVMTSISLFVCKRFQQFWNVTVCKGQLGVRVSQANRAGNAERPEHQVEKLEAFVESLHFWELNSDFMSCATCMSVESRSDSLGDRLQYFDEVKDVSSLKRKVAHNVNKRIRHFR